MLDVEGQRDDIEHVLLLKVVELLEIVVQGLFVADEVVELKMVVHSLVADVSRTGSHEVLAEVLQPV